MSITTTPATPSLAVASSHRPVLRITRRGRIVLGALMALPAIAVIGAMALNVSPATATSGSFESGSFDYVTVQPGESLWAVAERIAPSSDPRDVIADIERLNGIEGSAVGAGESLAVPASYVG